ncbi:hypothetical protein C0Q70_02801 [Pomacea canaliculata]|uniref:Uncharacterized protein n=1 Tax=Pomacea canaliculata TaxID=400727 RepID=A0A2T7PQX5_POMCA|nr:hypothetical protein C0Q70_02801 [Pomacea canaliculata]
MSSKLADEAMARENNTCESAQSSPCLSFVSLHFALVWSRDHIFPDRLVHRSSTRPRISCQGCNLLTRRSKPRTAKCAPSTNTPALCVRLMPDSTEGAEPVEGQVSGIGRSQSRPMINDARWPRRKRVDVDGCQGNAGKGEEGRRVGRRERDCDETGNGTWTTWWSCTSSLVYSSIFVFL